MNNKLLGKIALISFLMFVIGVIGTLVIGYQGLNISNFYRNSSSMNWNEIESSKTIELNEAERVKVKMEIGIGEVTVDGGATDLMEADFIYDEQTGEPDVSYRLHSHEGILNITQKERDHWFNIPLIGESNIKNTWNIMYNNTVPLDLEIKAGVGETKLNLGSLNLTNLGIEAGVGKITINLNGDYKNSFAAEIKTGVGDTEIILPKNVGVKIKANQGIGSVSVYDMIHQGNYYVNEAYETSQIRLNIDLEMGIGEVKIRVRE